LCCFALLFTLLFSSSTALIFRYKVLHVATILFM
jgi:hypothetical protein